MAAASVVLPFLPMLPTQVLLNNFLYDMSQLTIPTDNVDPEYIRSPQHWNIGVIRRFMLLIGPISSLYDFLTFYVLLRIFRAGAAEFHTGWFVESLATQTLVLLVIRTMKSPFRSRPSVPLLLTVVSIVITGVWLPFSSVKKVGDLAHPVELAEPIPQPSYNRGWMARLIRRLLLPTVFFPLTRLLAHLTTSGLDHLEGMKGPVIFAANHQSYLDASVIMASLPRKWRYQIAPAMWMEYFDAHFFPDRYGLGKRVYTSVLYRLLTVLFNAFPLSQVETGTRQSLRYIGELVEEGWSILIFPEGERTMTGEIGTFYPDLAMIASRMRLPVVPIRLIGLDRVLHRTRLGSDPVQWRSE